MNYCLSFSGGRTSAYMTLECLKLEQYKNALIVFSNTGKENESTLKFVNDVDLYLGGNKIVWVEFIDEKPYYKIVSYETASRNGEPFAALIKKRKYVPNVVTRYCTQELKIRVMKRYLKGVHGWKHWVNLVGIRYDEPRRYAKVNTVARHEVFDVEHPLVAGLVTKPMVLDYWRKMPFDLELKEHQGNCDLCFLKGMKKKQQIARENPSAFDWWIEQEKLTGATFVKGVTYEQVRHFVNISPQFEFDNTIDCFCNID